MTDRSERPPSAFRLNLEQQKNRAKDLLRAAKAGDADALSRLAAVRRDSQAPAKLADAQFAIAREQRFASWEKLKAHIASMERQRAAMEAKSPALDADLTTLHIRCGHDIQEPLAQAGFIGGFLVHLFPGTHHEEDPEDLRRLEEQLHASAENYERVVIWMEHDSWDQLILARLLAHYANAKRPRVLELIAVDEFPGPQRYIGLGQLPPEALRLLWARRKPVTPAQLALGNEASVGIMANDPRPLAALVRSGMPALPIMAPALHRHLRELPSVENGLRLTEQLVLEALRDRGPATLNQIWRSLTLQLDPLPYAADLAFLDLIQYMLAVSEPILTLSPAERPFLQPATITDLGRAVLRGERDWLSLRPAPRRVGGVRIEPGSPGWRWNEALRDAVLLEAC